MKFTNEEIEKSMKMKCLMIFSHGKVYTSKEIKKLEVGMKIGNAIIIAHQIPRK